MMKSELRFGPAGMPIAMKGRKLSEGISYCASKGLKAFEVEWVQGVRIRKEDIADAAKIAKENDVLLSCHAPYFVNCCSPVKAKQDITIRNLMQSARAAAQLGIRIIVFHPGFYQGMSKEEAASNAEKLLKHVVEKMKEERLNVLLGPETTGKPSQYGSLDEVISLCKKIGTDRMMPCIDFAHLHARENGKIKSIEDYEEIFDKIEKGLGKKALEGMHCHFSGIVFSEKGERHHIPIGSSLPFNLLAQVIVKRNLKLTIICESPLLDKDALKMKSMIEHLSK